jgi:hypothetical protein
MIKMRHDCRMYTASFRWGIAKMFENDATVMSHYRILLYYKQFWAMTVMHCNIYRYRYYINLENSGMNFALI